MEPFGACGRDDSRSSPGSHTWSEGDQEKTPKVPGDGGDCVGSESNSAHQETPEHEDSDEDEKVDAPPGRVRGD